MANKEKIQRKSDKVLDKFWKSLQLKQELYYKKNGKYFQLLLSPDVKLVDGDEKDFEFRPPSDKALDVDMQFPQLEKLPFQVRVHEWVGQEQSGYRAVLNQDINGVEYTRDLDSDGNDSGWLEVIEEK